MNNAEKYNHLVDDQYDGQKGRTAMDPGCITTLTQEIFHLQRSNAGITDYDAAACYDRMIP
eukprot:12203471-Ditylum_brightwellii.AAC.1